MKRFRLVGLALIAVFAFGALSASSAFAEGPEISPAGTEKTPVKFTSESNGETILESTSTKKVACKKAKNSGEFTSANLGLVLITFEECTSSGAKCNSPGDGAGVILVLLDLHLVSVLPGGVLDLGIWLEPHEVKVHSEDLSFTCGLIFKAKVLGSLIGVADNSKGELLKLKEPGKEFKVLWKAKEKEPSEQEIKECDTPVEFCEVGGKKKKFLLETEFVTGAHELSAEIADATLKFEKEVEFINF